MLAAGGGCSGEELSQLVTNPYFCPRARFVLQRVLRLWSLANRLELVVKYTGWAIFTWALVARCDYWT